MSGTEDLKSIFKGTRGNAISPSSLLLAASLALSGCENSSDSTASLSAAEQKEIDQAMKEMVSDANNAVLNDVFSDESDEYVNQKITESYDDMFDALLKPEVEDTVTLQATDIWKTYEAYVTPILKANNEQDQIVTVGIFNQMGVGLMCDTDDFAQSCGKPDDPIFFQTHDDLYYNVEACLLDEGMTFEKHHCTPVRYVPQPADSPYLPIQPLGFDLPEHDM